MDNIETESGLQSSPTKGSRCGRGASHLAMSGANTKSGKDHRSECGGATPLSIPPRFLTTYDCPGGGWGHLCGMPVERAGAFNVRWATFIRTDRYCTHCEQLRVQSFRCEGLNGKFNPLEQSQ